MQTASPETGNKAACCVPSGCCVPATCCVPMVCCVPTFCCTPAEGFVAVPEEGT